MTLATLAQSELLAVPFNVIPAEPVIPLWPGWIPKRHVTLVTGPGGTSKGLWTIDMAARVTTGRPWPGEPETATREPEAVILVAPEDDPNEAVAWRLAAVKADSSLVYNLTTLPGGVPFTLPSSIPDLRAAITEVEEATGRAVGLVILDPLLAMAEFSIASNVAARRITAPLEQLAKESGVAIVMTNHTVKSGATAGSKGLTDSVRVALRIGRPAKTGGVREVTVEKSNISSADSKIRYLAVEDGIYSRVEYPSEAASLSTNRGYTITTPSAPADLPGPYMLVRAAEGQKAQVLGTFEDAPAVRAAASQEAGRELTWAQGDSGSQLAVIREGSMVTAYTAFPAEVDSSQP